MKILPFVITLGLLTGCSLTSTPREERHKMEMSLHAIRTEMEDLKHDLNSSEIELHILEGKLIDQDDALASIKKQTLESIHTKLSQIDDKLTTFEKNLKVVQKQQDESNSDIKKLSTHASETNTALSQYRDKIDELEKCIEDYSKKISQISELKTSFEKLMKSISEPEQLSYVVKEGDSLEKIAKDHKISIQTLKDANHFEGDLIKVGQKIVIPKVNTT